MRTICVWAAVALMFAGCDCIAGEEKLAPISASELAELLGVQWWVCNVPPDVQPGSELVVRWVYGDKRTEQVEGMLIAPGEQLKFFYWTPEGAREPMLKIVGAPNSSVGNLPIPGGFTGALVCGQPNGSSLNSGDILFKMRKHPPDTGTFGIADGYPIKQDEIALVIEIKRKAVAAR